MLTSKNYRQIDPAPELLGIMNYREFNNGFAWKIAQLHCQQREFHTPTYFHPSLRLVFTLKGTTHLTFGKKSILLNAGEGAVLPNLGMEQQGQKRFYAGKMQKELVLFFEPQWVAMSGIDLRLLQQLEADFQPSRFRITSSMQLLLAQLLHSEQNPTQWQLPIQCNLSFSLLLEVMQSLFPSQPLDSERSPSYKRLDTLFELLHSGEADNWTLAEIAKACCSNPTTLQREFQQQYDFTIIHYLRKLKMQRAKQALLGGMSVSEAAQLAGYRKVECFSRQFQQEFGIKPSSVK